MGNMYELSRRYRVCIKRSTFRYMNSALWLMNMKLRNQVGMVVYVSSFSTWEFGCRILLGHIKLLLLLPGVNEQRN